LESLANQLAALTGVSVDTWLKPGTFTGPFDKAANLQNLIAAIGIWNALKAKPAEALNAIKTGLPNLWNSITNAFKNNPLAAWGTAIGTTIVALLGGYTAICGLSSTLSMLHLAGFVFLPLTGGLTTNKKQRVYGILVGMLMLGMILSACGTTPGTPTSTPTFCLPTDSTPTQTPAPTPTMIPPTATMEPTPVCITVQSGDNLSVLASKYCVMVSDIQTQNGLSSTDIQIGQTLCIKAPYYGGQSGNCVYPMPPGAVMYTATENNCANIAASFGLTVSELAEHNRNIPYTGGMSYTMTQTGSDCTVQPNAQLIIPLIPLREPSYYVDLSCTPSAEKACLSPTDSPELMLAHTLFGEGGSSISSQSSANIMQVALNRINAYYGRRGMSASSLSSEDFAKLLVRVMAMPYDTGLGTSEPAFNAFSRSNAITFDLV
jgi:LysM repeat protein